MATEKGRQRLQPGSTPLDQPGHRAAAEDGFARLRTAIVAGELEAGKVYSALELSRRYGVGRTPLREAIRRLQGEGFVEAQVNRRIRIAPLDIADLEQLYAMRIVLEALAARISVPRLTEADLHAIRAALEAFLDGCRRLDLDAVEEPHRAFHAGLSAYAGARIEREIAAIDTQTRRYRRLFFHGDDQMGLFRLSASDHEAIFEAAAARDAARCGDLVAEHVARSALILVARVDGRWEDPAGIRTALRTVTGASPPAPARPARANSGRRPPAGAGKRPARA